MKVKKLHWTFVVTAVGYSLAFMAYLAAVLAIRLKGLDRNLDGAVLVWWAVACGVLLGLILRAGLKRYYDRFPHQVTVDQDKAVTVLVTSLAVFVWSAILLLSMLVTGFFMLHGLASPALVALVVLAVVAAVELILLNLFRKFIAQPEEGTP